LGGARQKDLPEDLHTAQADDEQNTRPPWRGGARPKLSAFARSLLSEWERRLWPASAGGVVVAVSGGADSTALLLALCELREAGRLGLSVTVAHFNHELRGAESAEDARWVAETARTHGLEVVVGKADVKGRAAGGNLEQAARRARYECLYEAAQERGAWAVLAGHTLDDQAETVLLRLARGSGPDGLRAMAAERELVEGRAGVLLLRPLLSWARRIDTEEYCRARGVGPRRDEMNEDESFARVRVRKRLLPLLETLNPRAVEALARTAELLADDARVLEEAASKLLEEACGSNEDGRDTAAASGQGVGACELDTHGGKQDAGGPARAWEQCARPLRVEVLTRALPALRRRALRLWLMGARGNLRRVELAHVRAVERLLEGTRGGRVTELPGGGRVERRRGLIRFREGAAANVVEKGNSRP
jgi:tRNA(Ile)-lysidine synthase